MTNAELRELVRARGERIAKLEEAVQSLRRFHDKDVRFLRERIDRMEALLSKRPCKHCGAIDPECRPDCECFVAMMVGDL